MTEPAATVFTEGDISAVTRAFYARVRNDEMLAPIFAQKIPNDVAAWDHHMDHIADFWSSIFLKTGRFKGNPMMKHMALHGLTPEHFTRWLSLFEDTATDLLPPHKSAAMSEMAHRIAQSFQMGLAVHMGKSGGAHPFEEFGVRRR
ncbi:MAG: group III truncated hemoglobin [Maricaulaceae bacterium]